MEVKAILGAKNSAAVLYIIFESVEAEKLALNDNERVAAEAGRSDVSACQPLHGY